MSGAGLLAAIVLMAGPWSGGRSAAMSAADPAPALVKSAAPASGLAAPALLAHVRLEAAAGLAPTAALARIGRGATAEWMGWRVAAIPDVADACCFGRQFERRGCSLADPDGSWGTSDRPRPSGPTSLIVLVEARQGRATHLRMLAESCPIDGADRRVLWLGDVDPGASLALLEGLAEQPGAQQLAEAALGAAAYHDDPRADLLLERVALDRRLDSDVRQQALFWAGQARGEAGYRLLDRVLASEPDGELRQHALFALSQSSAPAAIARIERAAVEDRDGEVRSQALFWLAQTNAPGAGAWIVARLDAERDPEVREQAVFALSQLRDGTDWLLRVLREQKDRELVRQALFWLGQSDDPRAMEELTKILDH